MKAFIDDDKVTMVEIDFKEDTTEAFNEYWFETHEKTLNKRYGFQLMNEGEIKKVKDKVKKGRTRVFLNTRRLRDILNMLIKNKDDNIVLYASKDKPIIIEGKYMTFYLANRIRRSDEN